MHPRLSKISQLFIIAAMCLLGVACSSLKKAESAMQKPSNLSIHYDLLTLDSHVDTPLRIKGNGIDLGRRYDPRDYRSKLDFSRMDEGGLDAAFFAIWTQQGVRSDSGHAAVRTKALDMLQFTKDHLANYPDRVELATRPEDAQRIVAAGKKAIYFGLENGYPIGTDLENVDLFYQKGIRYITLCHTSNNEICDSSTDTVNFGGLSEFGVTVVQRMNDLGMLVDISHVSDQTVLAVLNLSRAPLIASHSCAKSLAGHARNLNDDLIRAIAVKGGVIQLALFSEYIVDEKPNPQRDSARAALKDKWGVVGDLDESRQAQFRQERRVLNESFPRFLPTVAQAVDHIDHIVQLVGIDHVGIGSDFDGGGELADCYDVSELPNITAELLKRGYSRSDIQKIWSGNFLRVFQKVTELARSSS